MSNRVDKAAAEKAVSQKKRMLVFGLCSLTALVICTSVVLLVAFSMITEGVYEFPDEYIPSATPMPENEAETLAFLKRLVSDAKDSDVVRVDTSTEVMAENIGCDGSDSELAALTYMKDNILSSINEMYPDDYSGSFGDGFDGYPTISLTAGDYSSALCAEGATDDGGTVTDDGYYLFTVTVPGAEDGKAAAGIYNTFRLGGDDEVIEKIKDETSSVLGIVSSQIKPGDFTVEAKSDRLTDRICNLNFTRCYDVTLSVEFAGGLSSLGVRTISFDYTVSESYVYTWAGISFAEDSVTIATGESRELMANAVMNDNADFDIRFESSDKSVATVDNIGYVTGVSNSSEPVTVTVYLSYLGHEYTDECKVFVCVPVEKIEISDNEASLSAGETKQLSARLLPENATNTDIIWISENNSIATVSDGGEVTAIGCGTATIIAVSADGHFRDSCVVTVTE